MTSIPRYRPYGGPALLAAGFRPFFLLSAIWSALALPVWLCLYFGDLELATAFAPVSWHVHEMVYGYGAATVAGFLLTAIPSWTGRMPLQGWPLGMLVALWMVGRLAVLASAAIGAGLAAVLDLAFPVVFFAAIAIELVAGRNWRNLPMLVALLLLFVGNLLMHLEAIGLVDTAGAGLRLGVGVLLMLISFIGGRIIPSFTRNWLARERPDSPMPAPFDGLDRVVLVLTALTLGTWVAAPGAAFLPLLELAAGIGLALRLWRWRGTRTLAEPLLWVLHLGYGWLALGFLLLAASGFTTELPPTAALHALTAGAVGTMTLAVMTRATLGHTGRPLVADPGTTAIYVLVTAAALLRLLAPLAGAAYGPALMAAGLAWTGAFALFAILYAGVLARPPSKRETVRGP